MSGILRLESLTRGNTLKQGDKTPLKYRLFDADGEKLNIAGKSAKVRLVYPDFLTIGYEKEGLTVAQGDTVTFTIDKVIPSRIYHVEIIVDDKFIFPSRADESKFTVDKSSLGTEANIIEIIGVDEVVRKAVDLINDDPSLIIDEDKLISEIIANTAVGSIEEYYQEYRDVIKELSEDKDYHSLPEIVGARGGEDTLGDRLDKEHNEVTAQLAQTNKRTESIFDIKTLGIVGDGSIDETEKLQEIIDYSRNENIKVINYDKNLIINISKPIYFDGGEDIDFGYANINKTTNTKGEGSATLTSRTDSNGDYIVDDFAVDAHFIFRHGDNDETSNLKTVNIHFGTTAPNKHEFAIFAPRVSYWEIENITTTNNRFNKFIYSYSMWQIPKFNNMVFHGGDYLLEIANDGANIGASTSLNVNQLYKMGGKGILKLYATAYSTFTNVFGHIHGDVPFVFTACRSITVNSAEVEGIVNGKFAWIMASSITFNSPAALELEGVPNIYTYLWNIENSKVVINAGRFPNYSKGTQQYNGGVFVNYGSHVTLNQCRMPSNQSGYRGLTEGSTLTEIDEDGVTVRSSEGRGTIFDGRKMYNVTGIPTHGKWKIGDIALLREPSPDISIGYICTRSGEFGATEGDPIFETLPSKQNEMVGTEGSVKLENLVENGDFSKGLDGWTPSFQLMPHLRVTGGKAHINIPTNTESVAWPNFQRPSNTVPGNKTYYYFEITDMQTNVTTIPTLLDKDRRLSPLDQNGIYSGIEIIQANQSKSSLIVNHTLQKGEYLNYKIDNIMMIDLTQTFGAGNEPTKEEMDKLIEVIGYIDGDYALNNKEMLIWTLALIRSNKNAIIALGGA